MNKIVCTIYSIIMFFIIQESSDMANTNLAIFFRDGKLAEFLNDRQDIDEQAQIKKL